MKQKLKFSREQYKRIAVFAFCGLEDALRDDLCGLLHQQHGFSQFLIFCPRLPGCLGLTVQNDECVEDFSVLR